MFHEINWIPIYGSIWIDPYISRFSVDYKRQEGSTTDYNNSILQTNSEINNISILFSNLNFHCPIFYRNTGGDRTFSVRRSLNGNEQWMLSSLKRNIFYMNLNTKQRLTGNFKYI